MSRLEKLVDLLLSGRNDLNIPFKALCNLLLRLGFAERIKGSHHIFTHDKVAEIINLQPAADQNAKAYQVRQVRELLLRYGLLPFTDENEARIIPFSPKS